MFFKAKLLAVALALISGQVAASICVLGTVDSTCTFSTDTSGGAALYTNPSNLSNIGSGVINPFLGTQVGGNGGVEFGVNTDQTAVNKLPLDDKRDNANTFTTTLSLDQLGFVTIGGVDYFDFFLDINEPNNDPAKFLSIDRLAIFGQTGATPGAAVDLNNTNITSLADVDVFPNLSVVYRLGVTNNLILNYDLFAGSGLGYDLSFLVPTSLFSGLASDSRIVFAVQYGGADFAGALAQDGFEEWAALAGAGPRVVPEPAPLALLGAGLLGFAATRRRKE
jgi:hypothetical protein